MTTTTTKITTAADTILGIDLGKYKSVACLCRWADGQRFTTFPTSRAEIGRLTPADTREQVQIGAFGTPDQQRNPCFRRGFCIRQPSEDRCSIQLSYGRGFLLDYGKLARRPNPGADWARGRELRNVGHESADMASKLLSGNVQAMSVADHVRRWVLFQP